MIENMLLIYIATDPGAEAKTLEVVVGIWSWILMLVVLICENSPASAVMFLHTWGLV